MEWWGNIGKKIVVEDFLRRGLEKEVEVGEEIRINGIGEKELKKEGEKILMKKEEVEELEDEEENEEWGVEMVKIRK